MNPQWTMRKLGPRYISHFQNRKLHATFFFISIERYVSSCNLFIEMFVTSECILVIRQLNIPLFHYIAIKPEVKSRSIIVVYYRYLYIDTL